jgi:hypothetical protein
MRVGGAGDLDVRVLSRNAWSRGTWSSPGGGTMSITAQNLATAVTGVKGTNVTP